MVERSVAVLAGIVLLALGAASTSAADRGGSLPPTTARPSGFPGSTGPPRAALEASRARDKRLRESWQSQTSKDERKRLRRQFKDLARADARAVAVQQHPSVMLPKVWAPLRGVQRRGQFLDAYSARVVLPGGTNAVAVSTLPLRTSDESGKQRPVDLNLVAGSRGLRPENPLVDTVIPARSSDPVRVGAIGFDLGGDVSVQLENDRAFYADAGGQDIDLIVTPIPSGVESFAQIRSVDAPEEVRMPFELPAGTTLRSSGSKMDAALEIVRGDDIIATVTRPAAIDAQQRPVPVKYRVEGDDLVMTVEHRSGDFAMPIMVDPTVAYGWNSNPRRYDATGWGGYQSNPASNWCSYFGDSYLGYGQYTYGRLESNFRCAFTDYSPYEIYEWNYYGEYSRGSTAFVEGWDEGYNFDIVSGNACHYSGIYSVGLGRFETYSGNECWDVWNNTRYHRAAGAPPNYAVFGTVMNGGGPRQDFTNQLWGATVFVSDRDDPTVAQGPRRLPSAWITNADFDVTGRDAGIGVDWTEIKVATPGYSDRYESRLHPCSADPVNHCPSADNFAYSTVTFPEGISTVSAHAGDLIRQSAFANLGTLKIDRTPPTPATLTGTLWEERAESGPEGPDDYSGYLRGDGALRVTARDGSSSNPRSGVASIELLVDGRRLRPEHRVGVACSPECPSEKTVDFTVARADVADGDREIRVIIRDRLATPSGTEPDAHTRVEVFKVLFLSDTEPSQSATTQPSESAESVPANDPRVGNQSAQLTATQILQARTIVDTQALQPGTDANRLLGGATYDWTEVTPFSNGALPDGSPNIVGAVAILRMRAPRAVDAELPCFEVWPNSTRLAPLRARVQSSAMTDAEVTIDFSSGAVTCAVPGFDSEYSFDLLPGQTRPPEPSEPN